MTKDTLISGKTLKYNGKSLAFDIPKIMGILNVTPDSFFDGGRHDTTNTAVDKATQMIDSGADIIDIGGYSTRPGATDISVQEEMDRVLPILEKLTTRFPHVWISVDTFRAKVAQEAITQKADIINDVSGGTLDSDIFNVVSRHQTPYVLMHMRGTPQTMSQLNHYNQIVEEVIHELQKKTEELTALGHQQLIIDPGFGFAKVGSQNFELMRRLESFKKFQHPLLVGISRKSMIYKYLNTTPDKALNGTTVLNTFALLNGADILRVHDIKEAAETVKLLQELKIQ